jgi:hypothetical protein
VCVVIGQITASALLFVYVINVILCSDTRPSEIEKWWGLLFLMASMVKLANEVIKKTTDKMRRTTSQSELVIQNSAANLEMRDETKDRDARLKVSR